LNVDNGLDVDNLLLPERKGVPTSLFHARKGQHDVHSADLNGVEALAVRRGVEEDDVQGVTVPVRRCDFLVLRRVGRAEFAHDRLSVIATLTDDRPIVVIVS